MKLRQYLDEYGVTQAEFARRLNVSSGRVNEWVTGARVPRLETAVAIERETCGMVLAADFAKGRRDGQ